MRGGRAWHEQRVASATAWRLDGRSLLQTVLVAAGLALTPGCAPEQSLENRPCDADGGCATLLRCCRYTNLCVGEKDPCYPELDEHPTPEPQPTDDLTVFAVGQIDYGADFSSSTPDHVKNELNMLLDIHPDVILRGWGQWGKFGTSAKEFSPGFVEACHAQEPRILFLGGGTASVIFRNQYLGEGNFDDYVTRDLDGNPVQHKEINGEEYRASLANPGFRSYLAESVADLQIQKDVDGLHYTELNADVLGKPLQDDPTRYDGNEGFDDYHLADFNAYLVEHYTDAQFTTLFQLPLNDRPRRDFPPNRLSLVRGQRNFDFRAYYPKASQALLEAWGHSSPDVAVANPQSFLAWRGPYVYWPDLVKRLRFRFKDARARAPGRHPIDRFLITANGTFPFVDLVAKSFYDEELPGKTNTELVFPRSERDGKRHLDGETSRAQLFRDIRTSAKAVNPGVPVVVYLDGRWDVYHREFSAAERNDFWRIFAAEAYAQGVFFAFSARSPDVDAVPGFSETHVPNALQDGTDKLFVTLSRFYRSHADIYHHVTPQETTVSIPHVTVSVMAQEARDGHPARRFVHFINHDYVEVPAPNAGLQVQTDVAVSLPAVAMPSSVRLATPEAAAGPDETSDLELEASFNGGAVTFTLPRLEAYDVVTISE